ncbi:unnamed protein product [Trichogramma brassicae]|uniref:Uncharacterized protein n=1 Tax=Trichogramma brassicae TaxID=86971 RepID=A0A6H5IGU0_9HYME|nr:unnamed protein product [Trichogramma brassicae]
MGILRSIRDGKGARKLFVVMYRAMERGSWSRSLSKGFSRRRILMKIGIGSSSSSSSSASAGLTPTTYRAELRSGSLAKKDREGKDFHVISQARAHVWHSREKRLRVRSKDYHRIYNAVATRCSARLHIYTSVAAWRCDATLARGSFELYELTLADISVRARRRRQRRRSRRNCTHAGLYVNIVKQQQQQRRWRRRLLLLLLARRRRPARGERLSEGGTRHTLASPERAEQRCGKTCAVCVIAYTAADRALVARDYFVNEYETSSMLISVVLARPTYRTDLRELERRCTVGATRSSLPIDPLHMIGT